MGWVTGGLLPLAGRMQGGHWEFGNSHTKGTIPSDSPKDKPSQVKGIALPPGMPLLPP